MESFVIGIVAALVVINIVLWAIVIKQQEELARMRAGREEWWDAYPAALSEADRAHRVIIAQRDAHEELQRAFLQMVRTGRAA